jgi:hypothetical protein
MLVPTFHPAAALRGGDRVTNQMREDFAVVRSLLDNPPQEDQASSPDSEIEASQMELFG